MARDAGDSSRVARRKREICRTFETLGERYGDEWIAKLPPDVDPQSYIEEVIRERRRQFARRVVAEDARPRAAMPPAISLQERMEKPAEPLTYLVDGWWPSYSTVVLAAQYKSGKTTTVGNLLRSLADGDPWLGQWHVDEVQGNIALLDFEMEESMLEGWLRDQRINNTAQIDITSLKGAASSFDILDAGCRRHWARRFREAETQVLILDCLRPALDALGVDEQKDVGRWLTPFDELLKEAGIQEAMIIHHMGHDGIRSRGDSRIRDWPAVEWRMNRETADPGSTRFISAFGRGVNIPTGRLVYDPPTRHLEYRHVDKAAGVKEDAVETVLRIVASAEAPLSKNELMSRRGPVSEPDMKIGIGVGVEKKWLVIEKGKNKRHLHTITDAGKAWLAERDGATAATEEEAAA